MSRTGEQNREFGTELLSETLNCLRARPGSPESSVLGLPNSLESDLGTGETGKKEK